MQKYMNYIQPQIRGYGINIIEGMILDYIMRAFSWANKQEIDGVEWIQLHPQKILDDLPLLGIETKNSLNRYINRLIDSGLILKKIRNNKPYYTITKSTKDYEFAGYNNLKPQVQQNGTESTTILSYNSNINNSNIKYITIPIAQIKEKSKKLIKPLEALLSSLKGQTDLKNVSYMDIIELWNGYNQTYKLSKVNTSNIKTVMVKSIQRVWNLFRDEYTKEEFNVGLQNYLRNIKKRKIDGKINSYYNHRFSLYQFISQKNGIYKFMAEGEQTN